MSSYLESIEKQFLYYKMLGEKAIDQIEPSQINWQYSPESNSIATIVKHLHGNMLSRWTDFLTSDGEKSWRVRDEEFENDINSKELLMEKWEEGWTCLLDTIKQLSSDDLEAVIYIRNQGHTVTEAINRQLAHYAYHVGQIIYIARMLSGEKWKSLSIPKGASKTYNLEKFSAEKSRKHFTDEYLKK